MAKLVKRVVEFGKSPKVKDLEKKMLCEAEGPKTRAKISKDSRSLRKNWGSQCLGASSKPDDRVGKPRHGSIMCFRFFSLSWC